MAGINFDASQVAPNMGFAPVPGGKYTVSLVKSEFKPTSNGGGTLLELHALVNGGTQHGRDIMFTLNWENQSPKAQEIGRGQFSAICHAVNVIRVMDTQQLHGIPFIIDVDLTPDGKYNNVIAINPIGQPQGQPANVTQMQPAPQHQPPYQQASQGGLSQGQPYQNPSPQQAQPYTQPQGQPNQYQPVQQPVYQNPGMHGQTMQPTQFIPQQQAPIDPMAAYQAMAQPNQQLAPQPQFQPALQQQAPQVQADVPDWIKNQQAAAQQAQPGNVQQG